MNTVQLALFSQRGCTINVQSSDASADSVPVREALQDVLIADGFQVVERTPLVIELTLKPDATPDIVFRTMAAAIKDANPGLEVEVPRIKVRT